MEILTELFKTAELSAVILIPIIGGIMEALKIAFNIDKRFLPLLSLILGTLVSVLLSFSLGTPIANAVLLGAISGLGASGLYDTLKKTPGEGSKNA